MMTVPGVAGRGVPLAVVVVMMPCNARGTKTTSTAPGGLAGQGGSARERTNTRQRRTTETRHRAAVRALTSPTRQACNALKEWLTTLFFASVTTSVALFFVAVMAVRMRRWPRGRTPQLRLHCRLQLPAPFASASFFALAHRALIFPSPGSHRCDPEKIFKQSTKRSALQSSRNASGKASTNRNRVEGGASVTDRVRGHHSKLEGSNGVPGDMHGAPLGGGLHVCRRYACSVRQVAQ